MPSLGQKLVGGLIAPRPARISLNDGRFTLILDSGAQHPTIPPILSIQVIFVGGNSHVSKTYMPDPYEKDSPTPPTCWSDNGVAPSDQVAKPESPTCAVCPHNRWIGTGPTATPPECSDRKKTAVLVAGAGDTVFLLDIPPASLKPFRKYMAYLGGEVKHDPEHVLTTLTMVDRVLQFSAAGYVPDELKPKIDQIVASPAPDDVVNEHDRPHQAALAGPAPNLPGHQHAIERQFAAQPLPVAAPEPVDMIPETFTDPRFAAAAADQAAREAKPMTSQEAEAHNSGKPARKPRSDKGVPRKEPQLGTPEQAGLGQPGVSADPFSRMYPAAPVNERNPPQQGFIQPTQTDQRAVGAMPELAAKFGMSQAAPAPTDMSDLLTKAFGLRIGK
jgi:hypothetical protein